jgi:hypothetical protein
MTGFHRLLEPKMKAFVQLCRMASLDSLIAFSAAFLGPNSSVESFQHDAMK